MQSDVNPTLQRRTLLKLLRPIHLIFQNLEWLSILCFVALPIEAFETNEIIRASFSVLGSLLLILGLALRLWSRGFDKSGHFVLDGPYRYVQNPDEVASLLLYSGAYLMLGVMWSWVLVLLLFALAYFSFVSMVYEESLKKKIGAAFPRYRQRVQRWIPSLYPAVNRTKVSFRWKKAFRKELSTAYWILGFFLAILFRHWVLAAK